MGFLKHLILKVQSMKNYYRAFKLVPEDGKKPFSEK